MDVNDDLSPAAVNVRRGSIIVAVRGPGQLGHLKEVLRTLPAEGPDIVAATVHTATRSGLGEHELQTDRIFSRQKQRLFSQVVAVAEKAGRQVRLLTLVGTSPYAALVQTAQNLGSSRIVVGRSALMHVQRQVLRVSLGPHVPHLRAEDIELVHQLWLQLNRDKAEPQFHHRDVIRLSL